MDKVELLKICAANFRDLLKQYEATNTDAMLLLKTLTPLFRDIENGKITPPKYYEFGNAMGKDNTFYDPDKPFHAVESDFVAALEDWESQPWFQKMDN